MVELLTAFGVRMGHDRTEALLVFSRGNERTNHGVLFRRTAQGGAVHLAEPEQEAADFCVAPEIPGILSVNKRTVVVRIDERPVVHSRAKSCGHTWRRRTSRQTLAAIPVVIPQMEHYPAAAAA